MDSHRIPPNNICLKLPDSPFWRVNILRSTEIQNQIIQLFPNFTSETFTPGSPFNLGTNCCCLPCIHLPLNVSDALRPLLHTARRFLSKPAPLLIPYPSLYHALPPLPKMSSPPRRPNSLPRPVHTNHSSDPRLRHRARPLGHRVIRRARRTPPHPHPPTRVQNTARPPRPRPPGVRRRPRRTRTEGRHLLRPPRGLRRVSVKGFCAPARPAPPPPRPRLCCRRARARR